MNEEKSKEDLEFEHELVMENGARLEDLAMALCHYDDTLAKRALAVALGTLTAFYDEPCLHETMELAEAQQELVLQSIKKSSESN